MFASLAPARRRLVLVVLALLVAAAVALTVTVLRSGTDGAKPVSQAHPGPVVLVPGYGGSTTGLDSLARTLRSAGKDVTVFELPGNGRGDLNAQAASLATAIDQVLKRTGRPNVDVVGYSAGGIVARLWVRYHGGASLARRVITLGSPHHGTEVATDTDSVLPGACPAACQQLTTNSSLLARLDAGDETPSGPTYVSIWTTDDHVVVPPSSASLAGALDFTVQSVCADDTVGHSGLPTDPNVQSIIARELAAGPPVTLTPADCADPSQ